MTPIFSPESMFAKTTTRQTGVLFEELQEGGALTCLSLHFTCSVLDLINLVLNFRRLRFHVGLPCTTIPEKEEL